MVPDKVFKLQLAQEADALRVLARLCGQGVLVSQVSHLGLFEPSQGKARVCHLSLIHVAQKVRLVLDAVSRHQQLRLAGLRVRGLLRVVAGGNCRKVLANEVMEHAELDAAVAHDIGVGRPPAPRLIDQVPHNLIPVLALQRDGLERHPKIFGNRGRVLPILFPRAFPKVRQLILEPDFEIKGRHLEALVLEQRHGN
jgi:hypothetical protein